MNMKSLWMEEYQPKGNGVTLKGNVETDTAIVEEALLDSVRLSAQRIRN